MKPFAHRAEAAETHQSQLVGLDVQIVPDGTASQRIRVLREIEETVQQPDGPSIAATGTQLLEIERLHGQLAFVASVVVLTFAQPAEAN